MTTGSRVSAALPPDARARVVPDLPYRAWHAGESRGIGRQMLTNKSRKGQTGDNWNRGPSGRLQGIPRLFEGEKYVDPHAQENKWKLEESKRNMTTNGFRYSSNNKKSSGLGNYYGCIGPKFEHQQDFEVLQKEQKPVDVQHERRQFQTSPAKKGYGYSTPGIIFGPAPRAGEEIRLGKPNEYKHFKDEYSRPRDFEATERKMQMEMIASRPPFKSVSHSLDFFDQRKNVVSTSSIFTEEPRMPERAASDEEKKVYAPFYPAKAPRSGKLGTFTKFPEYTEEPPESAENRKARAARPTLRRRLHAKGGCTPRRRRPAPPPPPPPQNQTTTTCTRPAQRCPSYR